MKFAEILKNKSDDNRGKRAPVIAFLGDSVTQGCFEFEKKGPQMRVAFDSSEAYSEKVKKILGILYPLAPVTVVNMGISGTSAPLGAERMERDILSANPDLLVVCFGLNDSTRGMEALGDYTKALSQIFAKAKEAGMETIFMTPNMMNTYTSAILEVEAHRELAVETARLQNEGVMDAYMDAARELCKKEGVPVCDCYATWKRMYKHGVDTTALLSNGLNHPIREMHYLFAWELVNTILGE